MRYISTRGASPTVGFVDAVLAGLAPDGGLYVPETWPSFTQEEIPLAKEEMESSGQWYAHKWDEHYQFGGNSYTGEFMALLHFLREAERTDDWWCL